MNQREQIFKTIKNTSFYRKWLISTNVITFFLIIMTILILVAYLKTMNNIFVWIAIIFVLVDIAFIVNSFLISKCYIASKEMAKIMIEELLEI